MPIACYRFDVSQMAVDVNTTEHSSFRIPSCHSVSHESIYDNSSGRLWYVGFLRSACSAANISPLFWNVSGRTALPWCWEGQDISNFSHIV
jgi:hypothetical protein